MAIEREKRKVQRRVGYAGIWLEDRENSEQRSDDKQRLLSQPYSQAPNVCRQMEPENTEEEFPEGIEDFDEEIPPKPDIRCQIRNEQLEAVSRSHELRKVPNDQRRDTE